MVENFSSRVDNSAICCSLSADAMACTRWPVNVYSPVVEIVPNVTGQVIEVPVKPLTQLTKGDVLFKIEPPPYQSNVNKLEASLKLSQVNLVRAKNLYKKKLGSEVDVDKYTGEVDRYAA